jgi:proteasome beta subunit
MEEKRKTGTTTVVLKGSDYVIIAADRRGSMGNYIPHKKTQKVIQVADKLAVTIAGYASEGQLLSKYLRSELKIMELKINRPVTVKEAANLLSINSCCND